MNQCRVSVGLLSAAIAILVLLHAPNSALSSEFEGGIQIDEDGGLPPKNTLSAFDSYRIKGDVVTSGVGLRTAGFGDITIDSVPSDSDIIKAYLYWSTLGNGFSPNFLPFPSGADVGYFDGNFIRGELLGSDISPCWAPGSIHSFRADVTSFVSGNGVYNLSSFADSGNRNIAPSIEGASLVVLYENSKNPMKEILIYEGAETVIRSTDTTTLIGFEASSPVGDAKLNMIVADGQVFGAADDEILVNGISLGVGQFQGNDGFLWDDDTFDISNVLPAGSTSLSVTLASKPDPVTGVADCLTWIAAVLSVTSPKGPPSIAANELKLFFSNDPEPNRPLAVNYRYVKRTENLIIADVVVSNISGAWFEVGVDFKNPSSEASFPISVTEGQIPYAFLLGPFEERTFKNIAFNTGEYLHLNATRTSEAAFSILAIDLIGRGLFGVEIKTFSTEGYINLSLSAVSKLLATIKTNCSGDAIAAGFNLGRGSISWTANLADFISCSVQNKVVRNAVSRLITQLYNNKIATQWVQFGADRLAALLKLLLGVPKMTVLAVQTFEADTDGFVRLEARP